MIKSALWESISDMLVALVGILQSENEGILSRAADLTVKLFCSIRTSISQYPMLEVIISLSRLLSLYQLPVATSCAIALNYILTHLGNLRSTIRKEIWEALDKNNTVGSLARALQDYVDGVYPLEYFTEMVALLRTILWWWPLSRYYIWNNNTLMDKLEGNCASANTLVVTGVLKLLSALALCGHGAMKLLESTDLLPRIVQIMGESHPVSVRVEALILCQHLMRSAKGCTRLTMLCCEPLVQGVTKAMGGWRSSSSRRVPADQMPLVIEACRTALMTRWAGDHHHCFWVHEIDQILLNILIGNCASTYPMPPVFSSKELLAMVADNCSDTHPYVWDILGYLAANSEEDFHPRTTGEFCHLDILLSCACSVVTDMMQRGCSSLTSHMSELEPVSRSVLLMVLSPCKYIASRARYNLSEMVRPFGDIYLRFLLSSLQLNATGDVPIVSDSLHTTTNLINLACMSTLSQYHKLILKNKGIKILSAIIKRCINSDIHVSRSNIASHLQSASNWKTCCWGHLGDWEGNDILLFYSLLSLSQLIGSSNLVCDHYQKVSGEIIVCTRCGHSEAQDLIDSLQYILRNTLSSGPRCYAAYILSFFGICGFSNKLGRKIERAFNEHELADLELLLFNGQSFNVHGVILVARCPHLLPPIESLLKEKKMDDGYNIEEVIRGHGRRSRLKVRMSNRVDSGALCKILEYVYTGFILVNGEIVRPLKLLAKYCGLKSLSDMLHRKQLKWGTVGPDYDLSGALDLAGNPFSDIILKAKISERAMPNCNLCQLTSPHMHAHKIILCSNCDYLRALFQSGMHDSFSEVIEVPIGWEALSKLITWFYSGQLPKVNPDCRWINMNKEQQLSEVQAYIELSSLAEYWCLEEVGEESSKVVILCLQSDQKVSVEIIHYAANLSQWKLVEAGVSSVAHLYPKIRDAGELDNLCEEVVDMLRAEYVRYSQEQAYRSG
ncbi:BTB/POZ domain-containing protein At1g04390 isoform X2 [Typha angustifolia]|uniref:BTB/POZ domain-containing protein At1g04390 isoform X2 n=1 Tax=Typha angustifolia TaxID=59011 RepID=UPI003C2D028F